MMTKENKYIKEFRNKLGGRAWLTSDRIMVENFILNALKSQRKEIKNHWIASKRKRNGTAQGCLDMVEQFDCYIKTLIKEDGK